MGVNQASLRPPLSDVSPCASPRDDSNQAPPGAGVWDWLWEDNAGTSLETIIGEVAPEVVCANCDESSSTPVAMPTACATVLSSSSTLPDVSMDAEHPPTCSLCHGLVYGVIQRRNGTALHWGCCQLLDAKAALSSESHAERKHLQRLRQREHSLRWKARRRRLGDSSTKSGPVLEAICDDAVEPSSSPTTLEPSSERSCRGCNPARNWIRRRVSSRKTAPALGVVGAGVVFAAMWISLLLLSSFPWQIYSGPLAAMASALSWAVSSSAIPPRLLHFAKLGTDKDDPKPQVDSWELPKLRGAAVWHGAALCLGDPQGPIRDSESALPSLDMQKAVAAERHPPRGLSERQCGDLPEGHGGPQAHSMLSKNRCSFADIRRDKGLWWRSASATATPRLPRSVTRSRSWAALRARRSATLRALRSTTPSRTPAASRSLRSTTPRAPRSAAILRTSTASRASFLPSAHYVLNSGRLNAQTTEFLLVLDPGAVALVTAQALPLTAKPERPIRVCTDPVLALRDPAPAWRSPLNTAVTLFLRDLRGSAHENVRLDKFLWALSSSAHKKLENAMAEVPPVAAAKTLALITAKESAIANFGLFRGRDVLVIGHPVILRRPNCTTCGARALVPPAATVQVRHHLLQAVRSPWLRSCHCSWSRTFGL